jgi:hypothetical protein
MNDKLEIPTFLKREETAEQAEKRRAKYKKPDMAKGLKVIEPYAPPPDAVRKAIAKDLASDNDPPQKTVLEAVLNGDVNIGTTPNKKRERKLPSVVAKAVAERDKLNAKKTTTKPKLAVVKSTKAKSAKDQTGKYDWTKAEQLAKSGKLPPLPPFNSYKPHIQKFYDLAKKKDVKGIAEYSKEHKDEKGARANMFRFRDLLLVALRHA